MQYKKSPTSLRLSVTLKQKLVKVAAANECSMGNVIEVLAEDGLAKMEKEGRIIFQRSLILPRLQESEKKTVSRMPAIK